MVNISSKYFDLNKIMDSGQCFRIIPSEDGRILIVSEDHFVRVAEKEDGSWDFDCTQEEFDSYWHGYLDLDNSYEKWFDSIDPQDDYLVGAAKAGMGLRVVNQDPWETLLSFIISQRRSVSSITTCVWRVCRKYGHLVDDDTGEVYLFPKPEDLAVLSKQDLADCGMGYRDEYILDASRKVASGELDLAALASASDQELLDALMSIKGVGIKVANCTALYGYHRLGLFPIDVWIKRVLDAHYPEGFPMDRYPGYSGFLQLLMFYEARH